MLMAPDGFIIHRTDEETLNKSQKTNFFRFNIKNMTHFKDLKANARISQVNKKRIVVGRSFFFFFAAVCIPLQEEPKESLM